MEQLRAVQLSTVQLPSQEQFLDRIKKLDKDTPSQRIRLALVNLKAFSGRKHCAIDMNVFFSVRNGVCFACLGGASAIQRLMSRHANPFKFEERAHTILGNDREGWHKVERYEASLDQARGGEIDSMFKTMKLGSYKGYPYNREITDYNVDPAQFIHEMEQLADDLEQGGY